MNKSYLCALPRVGITALLISGTVMLAQASGSPMPQQPQQSTAPGASNPGNNPDNSSTNSQDFGAKVFVSKAMEGDASEVRMGQLAQQKSQSNDVKQLAQKLVADHTQMDEKWFKPIAKQLGVSEPKGPSKKDKKMAEKLEGLSAADFDTQYLTMMLKDHQQDLKEFQDEAKVAQDPSVKQVAEQGANVISKHLELVEQIAKSHNIAVEGKQASSM
jgi:putative membrane protein